MTTPDLRGPEQLPGVSRETAIHLAETLAQLYGVMEERLVEQIAMMLRRGIDSPDWANRKRAELGRLRQWIRVLLLRLQRDSSREVTYAVLRAYLLGGEEALRGLAAAQNTLPEWVTTAGITPGPQIEALLSAKNADVAAGLVALTREFPGLAAVQRVAASLALNLDGTHLPVLRWVEDVYKVVLATDSLPQVLMGLKTRRQATQQAWARLITNGVTGFVDKAHRHWNLATYVEMATRTGVAQAAVEGHMDRLADRGLDLVIVSDVAQECALCRPWEGKVLSRTVPGARTVELEHATVDGRTVSVHIAGSIAQAVAAGLMHPNCRHNLSAYFPGLTRAPRHTEDPEGDAARQQLRYLERGVRHWKLQQAGALTPEAKAAAAAKVRQWQGRIRDHVAASEHLAIRRHREREQIDLGHKL